MEPKRSRRWMLLMMLFTLGNVSTSSASGGETDFHLDCHNDCESMFCHFQPQEQSCNDYSLTLRNCLAHWQREKEKDCVLQWCDTGLCCCSAGIGFVIGETCNATVRKRGKIMEVKVIDLISSLSPKPPTITSVNESNGNFEVRWRTNMENCPISEYSVNVTYCKKEDRQVDEMPPPVYKHLENITTTPISPSKVAKSLSIKPPKAEGNSAYYQIPAQDLEPSTTYVVSLRSFSDLNGRFSNSSNEWEFTPTADPHSLLSVAVICLSIAAVILTTAACCYGKLKAKWKNSVTMCPMPVVLETRWGEQELLQPTEIPICPVTVDPVVQKDSQSLETSLADPSGASQQQSGGVSTRSFSFSSGHVDAEIQKALWEKLGHLLPASTVTTSQPTGPNTDGGFPFDFSTNNSHGSPGFICFDNLTYSSPAGSKQSSSEILQVTVDSAYQCSEGDACDQHAPTCLVSTEQEVFFPKMASSLASCQISSVDSGRFSHVQDSSLSSIPCDTNTTTSCDLVSSVEAACESSDTGEMKLNDEIKDGFRDPCFDHKPADPLSIPTVDDNYQPFKM